MQYFSTKLSKEGYTVNYVESHVRDADIRELLPSLAARGCKHIFVADVTDNWLQQRLQKGCRQYGITLHTSATPAFLCQPDAWNDFFARRKTYFQTDFYIEQRKQLGLLLDDKGKPLGGKWTYDTDNRKKFPKNKQAPSIHFPAENEYTRDAREYVRQHYPNNTGTITQFRYPVTHLEANQWLDDFLLHRFHDFGPYEDALVKAEHYLHHSVLSPLLNAGLLTPAEVLEKTLDTAATHEIPLSSVEGFVRQITGWREFIRLVYEREGSRQRTHNYWGFQRRLPDTFYTGHTGILPIDAVIKKLLATGYNHHIERLMVLGNFMLLCEFHPDEVYRWFMEMYIDAYDWVMVPNVYGMTQFADGGLMTTKPYISGSNYLLKMSDYPKGAWTNTWDALFWRFMHEHRDFFTRNPRLGMLVKSFDKMAAERKHALLSTASTYLCSLD